MDNNDTGKKKFEIRKVKHIFTKPKKPEVVEAQVVGLKEPEVVEAEVLEGSGQPAMPPDGRKPGFFGQFPRLYWIADTLELFERGAYYGMLAVLSVHMIDNLGIDAVTVGLLFSLLLFFSYFWPLIASALAEKFGYKTVIMTSFFLLMAGYFMTFTLGAGQLGFLVIALILLGFGAGTFKPLISATIAHVTADKQRNLAYSLYYWFINFGAFIFPLLLGFLFPKEEAYRWIFVVSGSLIAVNAVITILFYTNPIEPQRSLSVPQAFRKILPAFQDKKFRTLLIIYSGFWFMYAVNYSFLPPYMKDFHRMPGWFTVQWLAVINPGTIIIVGPALGKFMEKYKSLNVMMVGIIIYCIGVLLTFWSNSEGIFVAGIIVYSIGEFIVHPGFIAYVSKIAPKDKVAIYMGGIFIATGVGIVVGPAVMGLWYASFVEGAHMPKVFGAAIVAVGLLTISCFILYNRWINRMAKEEDHTYQEDRSMWTKVSTSIVVLLFIPVVIGVGFVGGTDAYFGDDDGGDGGPSLTDWSTYEATTVTMEPIMGYANENTDTNVAVDVDEENLISITFRLTWTDEEDIQYLLRTYENEPDSFALTVNAPDNTTARDGPNLNSHGESGEVVVEITFDPDYDPYLNGTGSYDVVIECGDCGEFFTTGLFGFTDDGNDWELYVEYEYYQKPE